MSKIISVELEGDAVEYLEFLASSQEIGLEVALKKAIANEIYIRKHLMVGIKFLEHHPDGSIKELVFK